MKTKICACCKEDKIESDFSPSQFSNKYGRCRVCRRSYQHEYSRRDEVKINKEDYNNSYYQNNIEEIKSSQEEYRKKNKIKIRKYNNELEKHKRKTDPTFKLRKDLSRTIHLSLKENNLTIDSSILDILPYTINELKDHLEKQFKSWMTWNNWGRYEKNMWDDDDSSTWVWQIDHIIPQSKLPFVSIKDENFKKCWALNNLRPLSAKQNYIDGNRR